MWHYLDQSCPDCWQAWSLLHTNDSDMIFFVDPDNKALVFVEENTSSVLELNEKQNGFEVVIYVESRDVYFT